jgi:peptidyl-prolyl cis-trans isomerase B (cyclophilin B)
MSPSTKSQVADAQKNIDLKAKAYTAEIDTTKGAIRLTFFPEAAPGHVKNFLALAQAGFYNGIKFHRVVKGFVIQAGCPRGDGTGGPGYTIRAEFNEILHEPGVMSMARTSDPNSAGSQFFLCLERAASLDRQYTAFGRAADDASLAVISAIGQVKTGKGDRPVEDVVINKVTVTESPLR